MEPSSLMAVSSAMRFSLPQFCRPERNHIEPSSSMGMACERVCFGSCMESSLGPVCANGKAAAARRGTGGRGERRGVSHIEPCHRSLGAILDRDSLEWIPWKQHNPRTMDTFESVDLDRLSGPGCENTLVLTVNNRHARRVLAELSAGLGPDRSVMAVPDILPLSAWLRRAADRLSFVPESRQAMHTLDAFGSQLLWQRVIAEAEADHVLLDV